VFERAGEREPAGKAVCGPEVPREREVLDAAGLVDDADVRPHKRAIRLLTVTVGFGEDDAGIARRLPEPEQDRRKVCWNRGCRGAEPAEQIGGVTDDRFTRDVNQILPANVGAQAVDLKRLRVKRNLWEEPDRGKVCNLPRILVLEDWHGDLAPVVSRTVGRDDDRKQGLSDHAARRKNHDVVA
jgi:hypothetical protein